MQPIRLKHLSAVLLPLALAACGGGTTNPLATTPDSGTDSLSAGMTDSNAQGTANNNPSENQTSNSTGGEIATNSGTSNISTEIATANNENIGAAQGSNSIEGRVADGYLQGATICVDINENGACEDDEPQTISTAGGAYTLDIPEGATGKPIVADIPADAIDEDTGQPIGKNLVFSTPGDQPSFISPITTLVHQELKNNPTLDTSDAEATVLETLGLTGDQETSLFSDYVAESQAGEVTKREKFKFLHQTARVVASMLDEIQQSVELSAVESGIDLAGDADARKAVRQLVREEVRTLLPDISAAVSSRIIEIRDSNEYLEGDLELTATLDPATIAGELEIDETPVSLVQQIDAIKNQKPVKKTAMKDLLSAGFYMLDVDCEHNEDYATRDGLEEPSVNPVGVVMNDDGSPSQTMLPEFCEANYTRITMGDDATVLLQHYYFDQHSAAWVEENGADRNDQPDQFILTDGKWVASSGDGPSSLVEFTDDGGAILSTGEGKLLIYATTKSLDNSAVLKHLVLRGADRELSTLIDATDLFPADSDVHRLHIKRQQQQHVLLNWYSHDDGSGEDYCASYNGNCNVVDVKDDSGFFPLDSLVALQEGSRDHIIINELAHDYVNNRPIDLRLSNTKYDSGSLPVAGVATWIVPKYFDETYPAPGTFPDSNIECYNQQEPGQEYRTEDDPDQPTSRTDVETDASYPCDLLVTSPYVCVDTDDQIDNPLEGEQPFPVTDLLEQELSLEALQQLQELESNNNEPLSEKTELGELPIPDDNDYPPPVLPPCEDFAEKARSTLADDETTRIASHGGEFVLGETRWRVITVDDTDMIEIDIPVAVRHRIDSDNIASMLLIEDGGYVRRGARFSQKSVDDETSYSEAAFNTLRPVMEKYISR